MSTKAILRVMVLSLVAGATAFGQDVGADVGAGAGIFRAKNPETKKSPKMIYHSITSLCSAQLQLRQASSFITSQKQQTGK